jgi:hypothetical protein
MTDKKDPISDAFALSPMPANEIVVVDAPSDETGSYDMETARQNMHHLLQKGNIALDEVINVAIQSQHPQAFEMTAKLIKVMADVNKDLVELQEKRKRLSIREDGNEGAKVINQTLVVGSTADLQDMLEKAGKKK